MKKFPKQNGHHLRWWPFRMGEWRSRTSRRSPTGLLYSRSTSSRASDLPSFAVPATTLKNFFIIAPIISPFARAINGANNLERSRPTETAGTGNRTSRNCRLFRGTYSIRCARSFQETGTAFARRDGLGRVVCLLCLPSVI